MNIVEGPPPVCETVYPGVRLCGRFDRTKSVFALAQTARTAELSKEFKDLVRRCLHKDPNARSAFHCHLPLVF